jgi:hypothetical protein
MISVSWPMELKNPQNMRGHWAIKARMFKAQRAATALALRGHGLPCLPPSPLVVTMTRLAPRMLDSDGVVASFKAVRDEVAKWLCIDDGSDAVRWEYRQVQSKPASVKIEFEVVTTMPAKAPGLAPVASKASKPRRGSQAHPQLAITRNRRPT